MLCLAYCSSCLSVLVKAFVADVRHTDWHQGPFSRGLVPSQAQLSQGVKSASLQWAAQI